VLILTNIGKVYSFGYNGYGNLGLGDTANRNIPNLIHFEFDGMPVDIRAGDHHSIIFTDTNKVYSFGRNDDGQLGLGDTVNRNIPTLIEDFDILTSYILILSQNLLEGGVIKVNDENISIPYSKKFE
jgi:alpha-tubulin suppressor-like RCC1 family protein